MNEGGESINNTYICIVWDLTRRKYGVSSLDTGSVTRHYVTYRLHRKVKKSYFRTSEEIEKEARVWSIKSDLHRSYV